jgi:hypothetical protein
MSSSDQDGLTVEQTRFAITKVGEKQCNPFAIPCHCPCLQGYAPFSKFIYILMFYFFYFRS